MTTTLDSADFLKDGMLDISAWLARNELSDFDLGDPKFSGGTGFRYLIAKTFGIRTGMDFAWSEDGFAFYFTTGTAWGQK
jgi:hypothetical protein